MTDTLADEWERARLTDAQADAIVSALFRSITRGNSEPDYHTIASIIIDAVSAEITCQPLHLAYVRAKDKRS